MLGAALSIKEICIDTYIYLSMVIYDTTYDW